MNSIPASGRFPGEGNGSPLQYPCLGNPMNKGAWQATVHGVAKESDMTKWLQNLDSGRKHSQSSCHTPRPQKAPLPILQRSVWTSPSGKALPYSRSSEKGSPPWVLFGKKDQVVVKSEDWFSLTISCISTILCATSTFETLKFLTNMKH